MLRAKQLTNLSSTARTFLIGGSRSSAADGSSCTCADDDSSRRPQAKNGVPLGPKQTTLLSRHQARVETSTPTDAVKLLGSYKDETVERSTSLPQVASLNPSGRSGCVNYASSCIEKDASYSSSPIPDQFVRVGVAAVGLLSDVVSYKLPTSNGVNPNSMAAPDKALPKTKPGNAKYVSKESFSKVYTKPSADTSVGSKPTRRYSNDKCDQSSFGRSSKQGASTAASSSLETRHISSDDFVKSTSRRLQPRQVVPNITHSSDVKTGDCFPDGYRRSSRPNKMSAVVTPFAKHFVNNGRTVESVSHILRNLRWGPAAEEALENLNSSMDAYQANQVLKQIQDHTVASGFFYWLKRQPGFRHDDHTYTTMVGILGRAKQFDAINKLLDQMLRDGCQPNVVTYNRLIHSYGRANYLNEAVDVFNLMQKAGCEPDRVTYCTLIDIHAKAGYLDFALEMYQRMQIAGLSPDTFTFSVIINCLGKAGHLAAATRLFSEMVEQGCVPNLVTYNTMIALQAKSRNYESALKLYRDMQHAGFKPDKVTYSIVMEVLGHCGYLEEAEAVFMEMKRNNWVPDEPVYGLLVDLWGKAGNVEKAWQWYHAMLDTGMRPNVPTCNSLLSAFLRVNRLEDAQYLLQGMLELGLKPSLQTFTLLLSCCTEARSLRDMGVFAELMGVTGHPAHIFLISMPYAGPNGQSVRDHASRFLDLMHSEDRESKRGLIDAVVDFLHKSGLKEEAGSVWEVAAEKNVYPDAVREKTSSYWLINLHVMSDGTAVTALSRTLAWIRRQMLVSGICPSRIDIVTGWGRRSRVTGSSLVRQAVKDLLHIFSFPFFTENGNSGCFVGCGEPLRRWLLQSYVERMHLL